jgi:hypothetical protein
MGLKERMEEYDQLKHKIWNAQDRLKEAEDMVSLDMQWYQSVYIDKDKDGVSVKKVYNDGVSKPAVTIYRKLSKEAVRILVTYYAQEKAKIESELEQLKADLKIMEET